MSSHRIAPALVAREPKRERGKQRVTQLLDAAAAVFAENGYDAATMTEIAARAHTAIGSLYQFFPNKETLADALLARYAGHLRSGLQIIADRATPLPPEALADALVDHMLDLRGDRASILALLDARQDDGALRIALRAETRERVTTCVAATLPGVTQEKAHAMAVVVLQVIKTVPTLAGEDEAAGSAIIAEVRDMLRRYLTQARA
jgi:AcrR family transcriptional regulator